MVPINHTQAKLFDKKFVALTLKDARRCDKCKLEYDAKYKYSMSDNKPHSCRPVLLNCGHNICENCIYRHRHNLCCPVCQVSVEFEHTRLLKKSYDLNFCLLGQLINAKSFLSSEASANLPSSGMLAQETYILKCSECELAAAVGLCMHCKVDFCKRCFSSVHQNSKVLKKHKLSEFEMQTLQLQMPREQLCKIHKRLCDRYCEDCQRSYCLQCVKTIHSAHRYSPLNIANASHKDKIMSFLETMKQTRENVRKSQKEARACETRLEVFASAVVLEVSEFFLELHNHLQLEERRILDQFKKSARNSQKAIHEAMARLSDSQTTLKNMRSTLEGYIQKPPHEFHIINILEQATVQLEQMPCDIRISKIDKNPFTFRRLHDVRSEITRSYEITTIDPKINIRLTPMYGESECSVEISSDRMATPEPVSPPRIDLSFRPKTLSMSSSSTIAVGKSKRTGRVTYIINPQRFFIQDEEAITDIRPYLDEVTEDSGFVESIAIGEMYAVYHKSNESWLRAVVTEEMEPLKVLDPRDEVKYNVFFLDYGVHADIPRRWFRMIPREIKAIPGAAVACALVDIAPEGREWPSQAHDLMEEIIQNEPVQMVIQDTTKSPWMVDLFTTYTPEPISIREALLYTGMAVDTSEMRSERNLKFPGTKMCKIKQKLSRLLLHSEEFFRVQITHIENPQLFFAIKYSQLDDLATLEADLDEEYSNKPGNVIFLAQLHMACALRIEDKWYRGCIVEVGGPDDILVRLVDNGRSVTANWRQLRVLKERFMSQKEFAIDCSLADVQPLQKNNYEWTDGAIAEFTRMTMNPNIQMTIISNQQFRYQVVLSIVKKDMDINIGGMLVKFDHAVSTGENSTVSENTHDKMSPVNQLILTTNPRKLKPPASAVRTLARTAVQMIHIENPGQFYLHLTDHIPGIHKFHEELQLAQTKKLNNDDANETFDWGVNDHCMVLTTTNPAASDQWYRGVIKFIDDDEPENPYTVFLRDKGLTIRRVNKKQLTSIDNLFDRVCDAAILCHLACVHPTGGMETWSYSSIDEFVHNVGSYESLGATIQGTTLNSSIPVVLWGTTIEANDPLAPSITKYTNINKVLVCAGLAHLVDKIDVTRQIDMTTQIEVDQGQETLQDWYEKFKATIESLSRNLDDECNDEDCDSDGSNNELAETIDNDGIATEWLPPETIVKTIFSAYPTYVDEEAIVYLHDAKKHSLLAKMRKKINQVVNIKQSSPKKENETWPIGTPCLARYHLDRSLYRAVVHRHISDKCYEVRFVDYGNVETCNANDLFRITAFPNIPIQAVRYRIHGIRPKGGKASFSTKVLDLIHGIIVDKLCAIRVATRQEGKTIKKCSIRFDRYDLANYLIQNGYAARDYDQTITLSPLKTNNVQSIMYKQPIANQDDDEELNELMKQHIIDSTNTRGTRNKTPNHCPIKKKATLAAMFDPDVYKRMFDKMQTEKLCQSVTDADSEASPAANDIARFDDEDDVIELEFSFQSNYWHANENIENAAPLTDHAESESGFNYDEDFDPLESSSILSNFSGIDAFRNPQLPLSVKSFYCELAYARSSTIINIFPHLSELEYRQVELARRIQVIARHLSFITKFDAKMPCLARYSKDKLWYRAIVRSYDPIAHHVQVFYVDFLNSELLPEREVRKCPRDLLVWPLRTFEMKLYGVKPNPMMREKDVKMALKKCLHDRVMFAKIMRESGNGIEIMLFKSKSEQEVPIYEDLIVQNFFSRE